MLKNVCKDHCTCNTIIIIIITLFQEDNIFGTNASLTYGPQIQRYTYG